MEKKRKIINRKLNWKYYTVLKCHCFGIYIWSFPPSLSRLPSRRLFFYSFLSMNIVCTSWSQAKILTMDSSSIYYHLYGRFTGPFGIGTSWEYLQFHSRVPWEWEIPELQTIDVGLWRDFYSNIPICWTLAFAILTQCDSDWSF